MPVSSEPLKKHCKYLSAVLNTCLPTWPMGAVFCQPGSQNKKTYGSSPSHSTNSQPLTNHMNKQYIFVTDGHWSFEVVCSTILSQQELSNAVPFTTIFQIYLLAFFLLFELKSGSSHRLNFTDPSKVFAELPLRCGKLSEQNVLIYSSW